MKPYLRYTTREPGLLKPHTVVYHLVDRTFYEIIDRDPMDEPGAYMAALIHPDTGEVSGWYPCLYRQHVEVVAPAHPVYLKWAQRRLQDRLEGLDRS